MTRTSLFLLHQLLLLLPSLLMENGMTRRINLLPRQSHLLLHFLLMLRGMTRRMDLFLPLQLLPLFHSPLTQRETTRKTDGFPLLP